MTYDIIIIGAGSAGIPCAICAAERGLSVLLVEKENGNLEEKLMLRQKNNLKPDFVVEIL